MRTLSLIECFLLKYDYSTGCIIFAKPSHILLKGSDCIYIYIFPVFFKNVVTIVLQCDLISTWIYLLFKENAAWYKMMNRYVLYISVSIWAWYWKKIYQDLSVKGNIKCQLRMKFFCIKKTKKISFEYITFKYWIHYHLYIDFELCFFIYRQCFDNTHHRM